MASNPDISLECFQFSPVTDGVKASGKDSVRREPQPQAIGHDGHGGDPAEPKYEEPRQALRQRRRILLNWHQ
jgi:hypothetical protein